MGLKSTIFFVKKLLEKNENKQKEKIFEGISRPVNSFTLAAII